jgi:cytochrome c oxidase subunit 2
MTSGNRRRRLLGLIALVAAPILLSGCDASNFGAFKSVTSQGRSSFHLWQGFSIVALIIGIPTLALIIWAALRYRARKGDTEVPRQTQYHLPLEITYTIIPILIVIGLFAATVVVEDKVTANPTPSAVVDVNAFQWGWRFTYPGHHFSIVGQTTQSPEMVIPENENVRIWLTSSDVVHGFYVRQFNFSRYALPGVINEFTLSPQKTGTFFGQCTQLCGLYHSLMFFRVKVVTPASYQVWLSQEQAAATKATGSAAKLQTGKQTGAGIPIKPAIGGGNN